MVIISGSEVLRTPVINSAVTEYRENSFGISLQSMLDPN